MVFLGIKIITNENKKKYKRLKTDVILHEGTTKTVTPDIDNEVKIVT